MDIVRLLVGSVGNTYATGKVDEGDVGSGLLFQLHSQLKELFCQHRIILVGHGVAGQECMNTEFLNTFCFQDLVSLEDLRCGHSVLGIAGVVHDAIAHTENSAGIVTATDLFRQMAQSLFQKIDMSDIVQIDDGSQLVSQLEILSRCIIGREHDIVSSAAHSLGQHQLCQR